MNNIYFVRTDILKLNRSFSHILDAKNYINKIKQYVKDVKLLYNGKIIR